MARRRRQAPSHTPTTSHLLLLVAQGREKGSRLIVDETPKIVGRSPDADLVLTDAAASRRHVEVKVVGDHLHIRTLEGTRPFLVDGEPHTEIDLSIGGSFTLGATVLLVARDETANATEATDVRTLFGDDGDSPLGLFAIHALIESLDDAEGDVERLERFAKWSKAMVKATAIGVLDRDAIATEPGLAPIARGEVVVVAQGPATRLVVPARSSRPGSVAAIAITVPRPPKDLPVTVRRLLVVAARLFASSVMQARHVPT